MNYEEQFRRLEDVMVVVTAIQEKQAAVRRRQGEEVDAIR